jgi:hypothetical protein
LEIGNDNLGAKCFKESNFRYFLLANYLFRMIVEFILLTFRLKINSFPMIFVVVAGYDVTFDISIWFFVESNHERKGSQRHCVVITIFIFYLIKGS